MTTYGKTFLALLLLALIIDDHLMLSVTSPPLSQAVLIFKVMALFFFIRGIGNE